MEPRIASLTEAVCECGPRGDECRCLPDLSSSSSGTDEESGAMARRQSMLLTGVSQWKQVVLEDKYRR